MLSLYKLRYRSLGLYPIAENKRVYKKSGCRIQILLLLNYKKSQNHKFRKVVLINKHKIARYQPAGTR